ncbi:MAG: DUF4431 domain-containing protein [Gammaproteobacteria bacterium]
MRMSTIVRYCSCLVALLFTGSGFAEICLPYKTETVSITGVLEQHTFPGRPNYESIELGDEPETRFILSLLSPICTQGEVATAQAHPQRDVMTVQLAVRKENAGELESKLGETVQVRGVLSSAFNAHHHAPLLMQVEAIDPVGED